MKAQLVCFAIAIAGVACVEQEPTMDASGLLEIQVAPLSLPAVVNACYGLAVKNELGETVWSRSPICADRFGDGASAVTYVGACDASDPDLDGVADATVVLTLVGLYEADTDADADAEPDPIDDFINPCAAPFSPDGCQLATVCREGKDTPVELNLTVMRRARQGFFDMAVNFEDIFCSAKVDCAYPAAAGAPAEPIELVFDPVTGERVQTVVWAFACTDGDPGGAVAVATHLYMNDVVLRCAGTSYPVHPSAGPGNVYPGGVGAPAPLVQAMVFEGRERLQDGAADADKVYWNVALGLRESFFTSASPDCVLETRATASRGPLTLGRTPDNTNYPFVSVSVPINDGADIVCTQHGLDGGAGGVETSYTGPSADGTGFEAIPFGHMAHPSGTGVETLPLAFDECTQVSPCGTNATCVDLEVGFDCVCLAGHEGDPFGAGCVDIDECATDNGGCAPEAICANTPGSRTCTCPPGLTGDGFFCAVGVTIGANTTNYNLFTAVGSPSAPQHYLVTIASGVTVSATNTAVAAFTTGALPVGSTVRLVNHGAIHGAGGAGGRAGHCVVNQPQAVDGSAGGDALSAMVPLVIDNSDGWIFGGGGGGGGGAGCTKANVCACGGSGGGGQGQVAGAYGDAFGSCYAGALYPYGAQGGGGSVSTPGVGGAGAGSGTHNQQWSAPFRCISGSGGAGGAWGEPGQASTASLLDVDNTGVFVDYLAAKGGGAAGYAIRLANGATLAWLGGNTAERVKGMVQ